MFGKIVMRGVLAAAFLASAIVAQAADTINLVTGWNINWNINSNPGASPTQNIQIENTANTGDLIFGGYDLGLSFTCVSGTGKLAVASYTNPTTNSAADFYPTFLPTTQELDVGGGTGILMSNSSVTNSMFAIPASPVNLVTMSFGDGSVTPTVGSVFDVWADGATIGGGDTDYVDNTGDPGSSYGNTGSAVSNGNVLLGTVTITGVPEPSSLVLLGAVGAGFMVYRLRQKFRRRQAITPAFKHVRLFSPTESASQAEMSDACDFVARRDKLAA